MAEGGENNWWDGALNTAENLFSTWGNVQVSKNTAEGVEKAASMQTKLAELEKKDAENEAELQMATKKLAEQKTHLYYGISAVVFLGIGLFVVAKVIK
jgi:hypothetical protein